MCLQINEKKQSCFVNSCTFFNTITHLKHNKKTFSGSLVQIFSTCYKKRTILFRLKKPSCFVNTCTFFNTITHLKHNEFKNFFRVPGPDFPTCYKKRTIFFRPKRVISINQAGWWWAPEMCVCVCVMGGGLNLFNQSISSQWIK